MAWTPSGALKTGGKPGPTALTTFFDGRCPVCLSAVARYQRVALDRHPDLLWRDIRRFPDALATFGVGFDRSGFVWVFRRFLRDRSGASHGRRAGRECRAQHWWKGSWRLGLRFPRAQGSREAGS